MDFSVSQACDKVYGVVACARDQRDVADTWSLFAEACQLAPAKHAASEEVKTKVHAPVLCPPRSVQECLTLQYSQFRESLNTLCSTFLGSVLRDGLNLKNREIDELGHLLAEDIAAELDSGAAARLRHAHETAKMLMPLEKKDISIRRDEGPDVPPRILHQREHITFPFLRSVLGCMKESDLALERARGARCVERQSNGHSPVSSPSYRLTHSYHWKQPHANCPVRQLPTPLPSCDAEGRFLASVTIRQASVKAEMGWCWKIAQQFKRSSLSRGVGSCAFYSFGGARSTAFMHGLNTSLEVDSGSVMNVVRDMNRASLL